MKILFVCLGNICRSPLAEAVFRDLVEQEGLSDRIFCDSAGTASYHEGELSDPRTRQTAMNHGLSIPHRARKIRPSDFREFDLIVAMDQSNRHDLLRAAPDEASKRKVRLFREWDSAGVGEVPDPYYGGMEDFETVFHLSERSGRGLVEHLKSRLETITSKE